MNDTTNKRARMAPLGAAGNLPAAHLKPKAQAATREKVLAALPKLEALAQQAVDTGKVPGLALAIVFEDEVVYLNGFGVREAGKPDKVDADTVFQLASFSKPIASTVVAAIVSKGAVTWDTCISDVDPGVRLRQAYPSDQVTIRDLFAHRSGLPGNAGNDLEAIGFERDEILRRLRFVEPATSLRSGYSYSNFGITEGAVAAAKAYGKPWEDAAQELLYGPLGMNSTSSRHSDLLKRSNRAALHIPIDGKWVAKLKREPDAQSPAGGVSSNARDLAQWLRLELGLGKLGDKQIIDRTAIEQTHLPLIIRGNNAITGQPGFYGLGWNVDYGRHGLVWDHAGAFSVGARTQISILPGERLGVVALSNGFPSGVPEAMTDSFYDWVLDGELSRDWMATWNGVFDKAFGPDAIAAMAGPLGKPPASPAPPLQASAYAGTYANDYIGSAVIEEERGGLMMRLGPKGQTMFPLTHFNRDLFTYISAAESPLLPSAATFVVGPEGNATSLLLDDFSYAGQGLLKRTSD